MQLSYQPAPYLTGLSYWPRWLAGVLCYVFFGLGGLLISITILPLLRLWPGSTQQKNIRVQYAVHQMFKGFVAMLAWAGVIKVNIQQADLLKKCQSKVIIANHPTLVDVVILISLIPNASCIVKQGLWRNPFLRGVVSRAGYIPNLGAEMLIRDCEHVLTTGANLIIFPEGTRTLHGRKVNPFARGAANIALRTGFDMLPVVLHTDTIGLSKQQPWYDIPRQTITMTIDIGNSFNYKDYKQENSESKMARVLTRDMENFYKQQLENNYDSKYSN